VTFLKCDNCCDLPVHQQVTEHLFVRFTKVNSLDWDSPISLSQVPVNTFKLGELHSVAL
jgi:hypothetical protein